MHGRNYWYCQNTNLTILIFLILKNEGKSKSVASLTQDAWMQLLERKVQNIMIVVILSHTVI